MPWGQDFLFCLFTEESPASRTVPGSLYTCWMTESHSSWSLPFRCTFSECIHGKLSPILWYVNVFIHSCLWKIVFLNFRSLIDGFFMYNNPCTYLETQGFLEVTWMFVVPRCIRIPMGPNCFVIVKKVRQFGTVVNVYEMFLSLSFSLVEQLFLYLI